MSRKSDEIYKLLPHSFRDNPSAYDLLQAYVLLETCAAEAVGDWSFGFPASQAFPASEIDSICRDPLHLDVSIPGVFGADGPLPPDFRETIIQERNEGNRTLQDFLDLFLNRLLRLWREDSEAVCLELRVEKEEEYWRGWVDIPDEYRTRLGIVHSQLGTDAIVGNELFA